MSINYAETYQTITNTHKTINAADFIDRLKSRKPTYELTPADWNEVVNFYVDIDDKRVHDEARLQDITDCVKDLIWDTFGSDIELSILTAHGKDKSSWHIHSNDIRGRKCDWKQYIIQMNKLIKTEHAILDLPLFDESVYSPNRYMRCFGTAKNGARPFVLLEGSIENTIITLEKPGARIVAQLEKPEPKKASPVSIRAQTTNELTAYANTLMYWIDNGVFTKHAEEYSTWLAMGFAIRGTFGECGIEAWHKFSALSKKYDALSCSDKWDEIMRGDVKSTFGSIVHWAKQGDSAIFANGMDILKPRPEYAVKIQQKYRTIDSLIFDSINERAFRDMVYDLNNTYLLHVNGMIYLYYEQEWIRFDIAKPYQLRHLIIEIFNAYIEHAYSIVSKLECQAAVDGDKDKKKELRSQLDKLQRIKTAAYVKNIAGLVIDKLMTMHFRGIHFDVGKEQAYNVHFRNGVFDLKTQSFRMRTEKDYITQWLEYDYIDETDIPSDILEFPEEFFRKLHKEDDHREFCIAYNAYCITGDTTKQIFKMNQGKASNGKSTEFAVMKECFPIYVSKMDNRILQQGFEKRHKYLDCLTRDPIRLIYMEELPSKNLDVEFIKDFVDGRELDVEVMHGTKSTIICNAKLATCSQHDPKMDVDAGILRRGCIQRYTSTFVEGIEDNWGKREFAKVFGFETIFDDDRYKLAMFHTLRKRIGKMSIPQESKEEFKAAVEESDEIRQMLCGMFDFTNDEEDRISKAEVMERLGNPSKLIEGEYMMKLKLLCTYKSQSETCYKGKKVKGRFFGIRRKVSEDDMEENEAHMVSLQDSL
jgi:hypothetical protein